MANTAAAIEINDDILDFEAVVRRTAPYLHVVSPRFYTEKFAETLLEWLESGATWRLKETVLFKQYELGFGNFKHCAEIQGLWDPGVLARLRDWRFGFWAHQYLGTQTCTGTTWQYSYRQRARRDASARRAVESWTGKRLRRKSGIAFGAYD
jgi:hypothetical protein